MNEDFVSFELAKKLKKKGYTLDTAHHYDDNGGIVVSLVEFDERCVYPCPEIHQVLKWLRETKRIDAGAVWDNRDGKWVGYINEIDMPDLVGEYVLPNTYDAYEAAAIAGIEYVIDNLI